jgi:hypothetical protein
MSNELEQLACDLHNAKVMEDKAKAVRIQIEERIAALVETPENGSKTVQAGEIKVTVKRGLSYSVDFDGLFGAGMPQSVMGRVVKDIPATYDFDPKGYEALKNDDPEAFHEVSKYVTTKPKKVAVTLKI